MVLPGWKFNISQPWFGSQSHPHVLGSCHCGFLVPSWSEAPRSQVSPLSLETLQRLDPKTRVLCTSVMPSTPIQSRKPTPLSALQGLDEKARKGRICRNLFVLSFFEPSWHRRGKMQ